MTNTPPRRQISLTDGRLLAYVEYGDPAGLPTLYCHGFPSSRHEAWLLHSHAQREGIRLIAADRPGYGDSSPQPERSMCDWPRDLAQLLDHLELERACLIGVSGGGPYALACLDVIGERIEGCTLICPLGPIDRAPVLKAMLPSVRVSLELARNTPRIANLLYTGLLPGVLSTWPGITNKTRYLNAGLSDRAALDRPGIAAMLDQTFVEAMRGGAPGARQDLLLYTHPWPFSPETITSPLMLWHGDADNTVPVAHAYWYRENLQHCTCTILPGEGHFSVLVKQGARILRALREAVGSKQG